MNEHVHLSDVYFALLSSLYINEVYKKNENKTESNVFITRKTKKKKQSQNPTICFDSALVLAHCLFSYPYGILCAVYIRAQTFIFSTTIGITVYYRL